MRLRLKTKLILAISGMAVAVASTLSFVQLSQLVRANVDDTYASADFVGHQVFHEARASLELDLRRDRALDIRDPEAVRAAIREALRTDPGLNSLLQSIVGYSPTIYDIAIVDEHGVALVHTDLDTVGQRVRERPDFRGVRDGSFRQQLEAVFGAPQVYEIRIPLNRDDRPFGSIRVGVSTVFLKNSLLPELDRALILSALSILFSLILAAVLSNLALKPLEAISHQLDTLTGEASETSDKSSGKRGDEVGVVTTKIDLLGRKMRDAKEVFTALKDNLDQIMANLQDGVMLFTRDARAVLVSDSVARFVGRPRSELLGREVHEIFSPSDPLGRLILDAFDRHEALSGSEVETDSGHHAEVSLDFIAERGERIGALLTMRDAESVRRIEHEIELSRRLAAIGRLTSGVAHEVKNPINAIVLHLEVLRQKLQQVDPDTRRHMDVIGSEIQRLDRVVQTLVDFTRPVELGLVDLDLRRLLEDVALLAGPEAERSGVHIALQLPDEPLLAKADADLVKQAVLNIVFNGVQAMPSGGTLTMTGALRDGIAQIEVRDQGHGIQPELRDKIFNLYFTTREAGSGIGLAIAYRVMQLHQGSVEFESTAGRGTTFRLRFRAQTSSAKGRRETDGNAVGIAR